MSSRWQANKIGLINFWYYDEQEFPFVKGRILLRGANGSGKSVTMQSVVPLLLDGNMRPERLDPFGSRDRRLSTYLLDEDDPREERTGYLYLEFRREESDTYMTVGMGIRARKGKPLDTWYFGIADGRRVGKDFLLYRDLGEKIPLSRRELENRIGEGGEVFTRQPDYMAYVNRQIFGFETTEQYGEMIDLLIQLRTPKLSRDFKPTVINDILSDSLQPLSDEDLLPMAEAIENMDALEMNLKQQREACNAGERVARVYSQYGRRMLLRRAADYSEARKDLESCKKLRTETEEALREAKERAASLARERGELEETHRVKEEQRELLRKNDAFDIKNRESGLQRDLGDNGRQMDGKEAQIKRKKDALSSDQEKMKRAETAAAREAEDLHRELLAMQKDAAAMGFEEHAFFKDEVEKKFDEPVNEKTHREQLMRTSERIREGLDILEEIRGKERTASELTQRRDGVQKSADKTERDLRQAEDDFLAAQNSWKEALFTWGAEAENLHPKRDFLTDLAEMIGQYTLETDFNQFLFLVSQLRDIAHSRARVSLDFVQQQLKELKQQREELSAELAGWQNMRDPEPEREACVVRNRQRLAKMGVSFHELYRLLDFADDLPDDIRDRLEETLLRMGILDALVVDEKDREKVLAFSEGNADRYLFVTKEKPARSLLDVLTPDLEGGDIFLNHRATEILGNIAYESDGVTAAWADGTWRMGILSGTVTGQYEAGFIGREARERNRQEKIRELESEIEALDKEKAGLDQRESELSEKLSGIDREYEAFPKDRALKTAARLVDDLEHRLDRLRGEGGELDRQIAEVSAGIRSRRQKASAIAEHLYLACSLDVFREASNAALRYEQKLTRFCSGHTVYLKSLERISDIRRSLADAQADLDQFLSERAALQLKGDSIRKELALVRKQLEMTDYEAIREELDACIKWLTAYPDRLADNAAEMQRARGDSDHAASRLETLRDREAQAEEKLIYVKDLYETEYALTPVMDLRDDAGNTAGEGAGTNVVSSGKADEPAQTLQIPDPNKVIRLLERGGRLPDEDALRQRLNSEFYQNLAFLSEYSPSMNSAYEEKNEKRREGWPEARRIVIMARYQGVRVSLLKLTELLKEETARIEGLIRDGDRELFENILSNIVGRKIRGRINESRAWVEKMNGLMKSMDTSSGLALSLRWRARTAESEGQMDTKDLVDLLKKDFRVMRDDEAERLTEHFKSKVEEARRKTADLAGGASFYQVMKETLDYRKWFEFQLFFRKGGEREKELTNSAFGTFSGGEKAMAMYVPLFSAVAAKYQAARDDAPRLISLDEAFAGVDGRNIRDMFKLMSEFHFNFIINSQVLWGDCDTLDALAIYQLIRPNNAKFVTVMPYLWNGKKREAVESEEELERRE